MEISTSNFNENSERKFDYKLSVEETTTNSQLLSFSALPEWCRQNSSYITHGYRPINNSVPISLSSLLHLHNETINIFSHLLPALLSLLFLTSLNKFINLKYPKAGLGDYLIFNFFFVAIITCLGISSVYHTLICHSQEMQDLWLHLDFLGIVVLILGIFISAILLGFQCHPLEQRIYCSMVRLH